MRALRLSSIYNPQDEEETYWQLESHKAEAELSPVLNMEPGERLIPPALPSPPVDF